jgi:hypothetical protein
MADPIYCSGKDADVRDHDSGTYHAFDKWEVEGQSNLPEVTNFRTAPYPARLTGIYDATVTLSGPKDVSGDDNFTVGGSKTVRLYWDHTRYIKFIGIIESYRLSQDVKDAGRQQIRIRPTGALSVQLTTDGIV